MTKKFEISRDNFEKLLAWLDSDKDIAGCKYESIRARLIEIFYARGCPIAEELADKVIDRVARKVEDVSATYEGDPARYFYAVAKNIFLEFRRMPKTEELPAKLAEKETVQDDADIYYKCLEECLGKLSSSQQQLIIEYYQLEKQAKIKARIKLGELLQISTETLRVRAFRLRQQLKKCVSDCVRR